MRLLIVGRLFGTGGAERSLIPLAKQLHQAGHELTLLLLRPPQVDHIFNEFPGSVDIVIGSSPWHKFQGLVKLSNAIASTDIVIATSELTPTYVTWLLSRWHRKPLVADVQVCLSRWIKDNCNPLHNNFCRWIYPQISYIRCVSEGVAQDLQLNYGVPAKNLSVIYVPFDINSIAQTAQLPIPAAHIPIFSRPTIVAVGRFTSQKRFDIAIQAFFCLRQKHNTDGHLLILGDGELRPQLEQQVKTLELTNQIFMPGFVQNPHAYVKRSQVFLLSSDYEGLPRVLIEALTAGCPAVATDCPSGPYEILEGGKWGLLAPMGNPEAIADALAQMLKDSEMADNFRKNGLQRAELFNTKTVAQQYINLLNQAGEPQTNKVT